MTPVVILAIIWTVVNVSIISVSMLLFPDDEDKGDQQ